MIEAKRILSRLKSMNRNAKYIIENVYVFYEEMDLFVQRQNDYIIEYEIKVSLSDFKRDFKKVKHDCMLKEFKGIAFFADKTPNKFYFVCPENVIPLEMIPNYAGLIYISNIGEKVVKTAPFIHKQKLSVEKELFKRIYWRWVNLKNAVK